MTGHEPEASMKARARMRLCGSWDLFFSSMEAGSKHSVALWFSSSTSPNGAGMRFQASHRPPRCPMPHATHSRPPGSGSSPCCSRPNDPIARPRKVTEVCGLVPGCPFRQLWFSFVGDRFSRYQRLRHNAKRDLYYVMDCFNKRGGRAFHGVGGRGRCMVDGA